MANANSGKTGTGSMYRIIPCLHGVCASPSEEATMKVRKTQSTKDVPETVLLPGGIEHDVYLPNESIAFPREIYLSDEDLRNLDCSSPDNFSFTHYGPPPPKQDKPTNQDFALSGHFRDDTLQPSRFSILADGISNGFGFSQRGAQLSCFAAYECLKELHQEFSGSVRTLNEGDVERFRNDLAKKINDYLHLDRDHLLTVFEAEHSEPANIASKVWHKNFKDRPEKWYGNTLLVSFLSPFGGFVVYAGDGGIVLIKGDDVAKEVMRSDPSSAISRFVSMGVSGAKFLGALVGYDEADGFVEIISVTDGLDRTYQLNDLDLMSVFSKGASLNTLRDQICNLDDRVIGEVDFDNYSIARIFLPLSEKPHTRMTGNGEAIVPVALNQNDDFQRNEPPRHEKPSVASVEKKKADRSMKLPLTPVLLGIAIGLGLSNALVLGLASMNGSETAPESTFRPEMAAADAAARMAATSARELSALQSAILRLTEAASVALQQAEAAQAELTTAETDATSASERITALTEVASAAQEQAEAAQAELATAEAAFWTERDEAERTARIAAEIAATAITQMASPRP